MKSSKDILVKGLILVFGFFLTSLVYNTLLIPNDLVLGGLSGIALLVRKLYNIDPSLFILVVNMFLVTISFIFLGKKTTYSSIIGAFMFPLMIALTKPIAAFILPFLNFEDFWIIVILTSLLYGFGHGLIFKTGFTSAGTDILVQLFTKYLKIPEGKSVLAINSIIILLAIPVFGINLAFYAVVTLIINSIVFDMVLFDQSNSKVFYIYTRKLKEVKKLILDDFETGFTTLPTVGGYSHKKGEMLMCVLPNREYYDFKNKVLAIDEDAFFIITNCHESQGGYKRKRIPYI